jgi:dienelactone hydrolase
MTSTTLTSLDPTCPPARQSRRFPSGTDTCDAWLYLPAGAGAQQRVPVIVMAHGLGGVKQAGLAPFAERFRDAGYACLVFDYRCFGDSTGEPRQWLDITRQLADWQAAVAYARSLPEVDAARVVVWGTSFAGGHVIATAARDAGIAAVVAQCPFTDGLSSALAMDLRTSLKLSWLALKDLVAHWRGRAPVRGPTAGRPGEAALMTAPNAWAGYHALHAASGLADSLVMVPARIALRIPLYTPGRAARRVACPILFAVCENDTVAPAGATLRHASRAPRAEVRRYPYGHFDIYLGTPFERNVQDQLTFLRTHVLPASIG